MKLKKKYTKKYIKLPLVKMTKKYAIKFYTGGVNVKKWSELTPTQKQEALKKSWYIRWYYKNPKTKKLQRQGNIKAGVNRFHKMSSRVKFLKKAKKRGHKTLNGETMFLYQAQKAFEIWHNISPKIDNDLVEFLRK